MRLIRANYLSKPEFDAENMKQVSAAAEGLCFWVKAIDIYNKIAKVVEPKKEKLKKSELMHEKVFRAKKTLVKIICLKEKTPFKTKNAILQEDKSKFNRFLENERGRWDSNLKVLKIEYEVFKRNCLIGAVYVELLNNVDYDERKVLLLL
uniref:Dynein heavy chain coiled coil stalk domain-containing protein n=1 Tax=Panagrolaimus davidi TaxID=227884 RepID=A0A914QW23_9BILA